jgi:hypothetical protein
MSEAIRGNDAGPATLACLADFLKGRDGDRSERWTCALDWGAELELIRMEARAIPVGAEP